MEQPEDRILHHSRIARDLLNAATVLNPIADIEVASDISYTFAQSLDNIATHFEALVYDMVFFRLPGRLTQQVRDIIERTWDGLVIGGKMCIYATIHDDTDLEAVLGARTSQIYIRDYDEMIFVWNK